VKNRERHQVIRSSGRDLNQGPPDYEGVLPILPRWLVNFLIKLSVRQLGPLLKIEAVHPHRNRDFRSLPFFSLFGAHTSEMFLFLSLFTDLSLSVLYCVCEEYMFTRARVDPNRSKAFRIYNYCLHESVISNFNRLCVFIDFMAQMRLLFKCRINGLL
jgi:hypothetical protein